jgi:hypothetical protein
MRIEVSTFRGNGDGVAIEVLDLAGVFAHSRTQARAMRYFRNVERQPGSYCGFLLRNAGLKRSGLLHILLVLLLVLLLLLHLFQLFQQLF